MNQNISVDLTEAAQATAVVDTPFDQLVTLQKLFYGALLNSIYAR